MDAVLSVGECREGVPADRQASPYQDGCGLGGDSDRLCFLLVVRQLSSRHDSPCPQLTRFVTAGLSIGLSVMKCD